MIFTKREACLDNRSWRRSNQRDFLFVLEALGVKDLYISYNFIDPLVDEEDDVVPALHDLKYWNSLGFPEAVAVYAHPSEWAAAECVTILRLGTYDI